MSILFTIDVSGAWSLAISPFVFVTDNACQLLDVKLRVTDLVDNSLGRGVNGLDAGEFIL